VAFPTGTLLNVTQSSTGQLTIVGAGGVSIYSTGATSTTPKTRVANSVATCIKVGANDWLVTGDIV
jgi:hypothetical protein